MATRNTANFLTGVIEGFYGAPWSRAERLELFEWMTRWGLNTYLYAPKDDLKHRAIWRDPYSSVETESFHELIAACRQRDLHFIYALSPGLDIRYHAASELDHLRARLGQMMALGCRYFALLFDDLPDRPEAQEHGSLASAQAQVTNALFRWTRQQQPDARFLFCPTPYCGRMAMRHVGGEGYLSILGRELHQEIDVFWTGPEIISREIPVAHLQQISEVLRRPPVLWDNLHANDYDGHRFYCGPYSGRSPELRGAVNGLLINPNCEFPLNYVPLRTFAEFARADSPWHPRKAYLSAVQEWLPNFATVGKPITLEDLVLLADCYYLPYEDGAEADALYQSVRELLRHPAERWGTAAEAFQRQATRLRDVCARLTELRNRPLFHALGRRVWELREEMDLLDRYVGWTNAKAGQAAACQSDSHLPGTYRGGLVARLQRLLLQGPDGTFCPASTDQGAGPTHQTRCQPMHSS